MKKEDVHATDVRQHFDRLADTYDRIKKEKNSYYYQSLIHAISLKVPPGKKVLDIGTGTGEILNALRPAEGTGVDLSPRMIEIAKKKFPALRFLSGLYETMPLGNSFDFILLVDVIEHMESAELFFKNVGKFCNPSTRIVLTMANPCWEPFLAILEKLKLKMEEGPHYRISEKQMLRYASENGLQLVSKDNFTLLPINIPFLSPLFNESLIRLPGIKNLALVQCYVFKSTS